jgi:hypothetical protein
MDPIPLVKPDCHPAEEISDDGRLGGLQGKSVLVVFYHTNQLS